MTYCRFSHRATLAWFAIKYLLGRENVLVYDEPWTEWGTIVGFPHGDRLMEMRRAHYRSSGGNATRIGSLPDS